MPTDAERLAQMNEWLQRERATDPKLAELLSGIPNALFGPEPKRITAEHWILITENAPKTDDPKAEKR